MERLAYRSAKSRRWPGRPKDELVRKMQDFKAGRAQGTIMPQLAKGFTDEQIDVVAAWYAARPAK
jgi:cytochrome c553